MGDELNDRLLANSKGVLASLPPLDASTPAPLARYVDVGDANTLLVPEPVDPPTGWVRGADGKLHMWHVTPLPGCTGHMLTWWFRFCDDSTKYKWWHPVDHLRGTWTPGYLAVPLEQRKDGHHVGESHVVSEAVGGVVQDLHIDFKPPEEYMDTSLFPKAGVTCCLWARINVFDKVAGDVAVGHLCHMVVEVDGRAELRSRLGRTLRGPDSLARAVLKHCREEFACLAAILPELYAMHNTASSAAPPMMS